MATVPLKLFTTNYVTLLYWSRISCS